MQGDQINRKRPFKQGCFFETGGPKNTISTWVKNKQKYFQVKKLRETDIDKLDHFIFRWLISKSNQNIPIDGIC